MRYCILLRMCQSFDFLLKISGQHLSVANHEKAGDRHRERNNTRKLTIAVISECHHCFYLMCSGKKCSELQKFLMGKVELPVHTYM
jgi:hypothetical protein